MATNAQSAKNNPWRIVTENQIGTGFVEKTSCPVATQQAGKQRRRHRKQLTAGTVRKDYSTGKADAGTVAGAAPLLPTRLLLEMQDQLHFSMRAAQSLTMKWCVEDQRNKENGQQQIASVRDEAAALCEMLEGAAISARAIFRAASRAPHKPVTRLAGEPGRREAVGIASDKNADSDRVTTDPRSDVKKLHRIGGKNRPTRPFPDFYVTHNTDGTCDSPIELDALPAQAPFETVQDRWVDTGWEEMASQLQAESKDAEVPNHSVCAQPLDTAMSAWPVPHGGGHDLPPPKSAAVSVGPEIGSLVAPAVVLAAPPPTVYTAEGGVIIVPTEKNAITNGVGATSYLRAGIQEPAAGDRHAAATTAASSMSAMQVSRCGTERRDSSGLDQPLQPEPAAATAAQHKVFDEGGKSWEMSELTAAAAVAAAEGKARALERKLQAERREKQMAQMAAKTLRRRADRAQTALAQAEDQCRCRWTNAREENEVLASVIDRLEGIVFTQQDCILHPRMPSRVQRQASARTTRPFARRRHPNLAEPLPHHTHNGGYHASSNKGEVSPARWRHDCRGEVENGREEWGSRIRERGNVGPKDSVVHKDHVGHKYNGSEEKSARDGGRALRGAQTSDVPVVDLSRTIRNVEGGEEELG